MIIKKLIIIYVIGHVTPELYPTIKKDTKVNYFIQSFYSVPVKLHSFFNDKKSIKDLKYTKIKIRTYSKYLTKDLWIKNSTPIEIKLAEILMKFIWIWSIILFLLSSCLASMFAGMLIFKNVKISKKKFALLGVWNLFTIIGFSIATLFLKTERLDSKLEHKLTSKGIIFFDQRKILFVILFSIFFLIITFIFQFILQILF